MKHYDDWVAEHISKSEMEERLEDAMEIWGKATEAPNRETAQLYIQHMRQRLGPYLSAARIGITLTVVDSMLMKKPLLQLTNGSANEKKNLPSL